MWNGRGTKTPLAIIVDAFHHRASDVNSASLERAVTTKGVDPETTTPEEGPSMDHIDTGGGLDSASGSSVPSDMYIWPVTMSYTCTFPSLLVATLRSCRRRWEFDFGAPLDAHSSAPENMLMDNVALVAATTRAPRSAARRGDVCWTVKEP